MAAMKAMKNLLIRCLLSCADLNEEAMKGNQYESQMIRPKESLGVFYEELKLAKKEMIFIRKLFALLQVAFEEIILVARQCVARAARDRMNIHRLDLVKISLIIRGCFKEDIDRFNSANRYLPYCSKETAVDWIRSVHHTNMLKIKELMMDILRVRQRIMADLMMDVSHRYFSVTGEVTSEEILSAAIYSSGSRGKNIAALCEMLNLYKAIKDMKNRFDKILLDTVDSLDDEMMNNHALNAASYNKSGTKELNSA